MVRVWLGNRVSGRAGNMDKFKARDRVRSRVSESPTVSFVGRKRVNRRVSATVNIRVWDSVSIRIGDMGRASFIVSTVRARFTLRTKLGTELGLGCGRL